LWYVLEGEHIIQVGDDEFQIGPGELAFGPRGGRSRRGTLDQPGKETDPDPERLVALSGRRLGLKSVSEPLRSSFPCGVQTAMLVLIPDREGGRDFHQRPVHRLPEIGIPS
jgi:hypothetical protein